MAGESVLTLISKVGSLFSIPIRFSDRLLVSIPFKNVMVRLLALVEITLAIRFNLDALKDKMNGRSLLLNQVARSNRKHGRFSAERDMEPVQTYSAYPLFGGNCYS